MMKFRAFILFVILSLFIPTFVFAKFLRVNDIINRSYYLPVLGKTVTFNNGFYRGTYIEKFENGSTLTVSQSAWINSFLVVEFPNLPNYNVAIVSMYEHCCGNGAYATVRALVSNYLNYDSGPVYLTNTIDLGNDTTVDGIFQFKNNTYMFVRVLGKNDPMCCPSKTELFELNVYKSDNKFYLIARQVNRFK